MVLSKGQNRYSLAWDSINIENLVTTMSENSKNLDMFKGMCLPTGMWDLDYNDIMHSMSKATVQDLIVKKIGGHENPSDCMTKNLSADHSKYLLAKVGFQFVQGRSDLAPVRADV